MLLINTCGLLALGNALRATNILKKAFDDQESSIALLPRRNLQEARKDSSSMNSLPQYGASYTYNYYDGNVYNYYDGREAADASKHVFNFYGGERADDDDHQESMTRTVRATATSSAVASAVETTSAVSPVEATSTASSSTTSTASSSTTSTSGTTPDEVQKVVGLTNKKFQFTSTGSPGESTDVPFWKTEWSTTKPKLTTDVAPATTTLTSTTTSTEEPTTTSTSATTVEPTMPAGGEVGKLEEGNQGNRSFFDGPQKPDGWFDGKTNTSSAMDAIRRKRFINPETVVMKDGLAVIPGFANVGNGFCRALSCVQCAPSSSFATSCVPSLSDCANICSNARCPGFAFAATPSDNSNGCLALGLGRCNIYATGPIGGTQTGSFKEYECHSANTGAAAVVTNFVSVGFGFCREQTCTSCSASGSFESFCEASVESCSSRCQGSTCSGFAFAARPNDNSNNCQFLGRGRCNIYTGVNIGGTQTGTFTEYECFRPFGAVTPAPDSNPPSTNIGIPTLQQANEMASLLIAWMNGNPNKNRAQLIRYAFHDAGTWNRQARNGGTHGCLADPNGPQLRNLENLGLEQTIIDLNRIFEDSGASRVVSRADFFQFGANLAVSEATQAAQNIGTGERINVPFRWGRKDCTNQPGSCPNCQGEASDGTTFANRLPKPGMFLGEIMQIMGNGLGFSADEVVALIGAHSMGSFASRPGNGLDFDGSWTPPNRAGVLDNQYFRYLGQDWLRTKRNAAANNPEIWIGVFNQADAEMKQCLNRGPNGLMSPFNRCNNFFTAAMLRSDVELGWDTRGGVCEIENNCPKRDGGNRGTTLLTVQRFANNNREFLNMFGPTFQKMQELGGDALSFAR